jgi:hypothetical protein
MDDSMFKRNTDLVSDFLISHFKIELDEINPKESAVLSRLIAISFCSALRKRDIEIDELRLKALLGKALDYIAKGRLPNDLSPLLTDTIDRCRVIAPSSLIPNLN